MDTPVEEPPSPLQASSLPSLENQNRVSILSSPTGRAELTINGTDSLQDQVLNNPDSTNTPPTVMEGRAVVPTATAIAQSLASSVVVLNNPAIALTPLAALDVDLIPAASAITQPMASSVVVPCSSSNPNQRETAIAVIADANSHKRNADHQAFHASIAALSSPESAVISKLTSRIKLIDGALDGVPKLASSREGSSGNGGSKLKQGLEPCLNPPLSQ